MKKTSISFGLVNIPVSMSPAIKNNDISFNQLHVKCLERIKYVKYCPHCKKDVSQSDIIRGYQYEDDRYVTLSQEEFDKLKSNDDKTIEIVGFVDLEEVDPVYFEKSYNLFTSSKSKAFSLFRDALLKTKKVALAKTVLGTKFYYVILRVSGDALIMNTLYFEEEVLLRETVEESSCEKKELDLAVQLISSLEMSFKPEELKDEYQDKIKKALELKISGKEIKKTRKRASNNIKDLMTALEMSLKNV